MEKRDPSTPRTSQSAIPFRLSTRRQFLGALPLGAAGLGLVPRLLRPRRGGSVEPLSLDGALEHIADQMDRFHRTLDVYTDAGEGGNHFVALAKFGDDPRAIDIDLCSTDNPHAGLTSIKNTFHNTSGQNFGGWFFLNGILAGDARQPGLNFGDTPNAGVDLRGATELSFWARGQEGGEKVEFFMGGIGRNPEDGSPNAPFPDSTARTPPPGVLFTLTKTWTRFTIDLSASDLSYVLNGFGWACSAANNLPGAVFWVDDIQYNKPRLDEPRFIPSYVTVSNHPFDVVHRNVAFAYDNAVAMLAFMGRGNADDWRRAKLIADALVYAQAHDRRYGDGRVRNAYQAGDLALPPGWAPGGKTGVVRLPSILDCAKGETVEDRFQVGSHTGSVAWAAIGLLTYHEKAGSAQYLQSARLMAEWIEGRRRNTGEGGYRGGFEGLDDPSQEFPNDPATLPWASTEHNMDAYVVFTKLFKITGEPVWKERADHARRFIEAMWDADRRCFFAGMKDAATIDRDSLLLDVQAWAVLTQPDGLSRFPSVLRCAEMHHRTEKDGLIGFDFNDDRDGVWLEGTAHMAVAYARAGEPGKSEEVLAQLRLAQRSARNSNGRGLPAASHDEVTTGLAQQDGRSRLSLFSRLHVGATGWHAFAELKANPFRLFDTKTPRINGASVSGKKLIVTGEDFESGAVVLLNGKRQKTANDDQDPDKKLVAKKAGRKIRAGDKLKVQNANGSESNELTYQP
ncbi:MAG TPA: hypothetical protein VE262_03970 [Blastocatellia bacterium]|nr:hypothetical protein [Blastocatellia bacterium]